MSVSVLRAERHTTRGAQHGTANCVIERLCVRIQRSEISTMSATTTDDVWPSYRQQESMYEFLVPHGVVGLIIGKEGKTIKRVRVGVSYTSEEICSIVLQLSAISKTTVVIVPDHPDAMEGYQVAVVYGESSLCVVIILAHCRRPREHRNLLARPAQNTGCLL